MLFLGASTCGPSGGMLLSHHKRLTVFGPFRVGEDGAALGVDGDVNVKKRRHVDVGAPAALELKNYKFFASPKN